jgi:hypothetical protein
MAVWSASPAGADPASNALTDPIVVAQASPSPAPMKPVASPAPSPSPTPTPVPHAFSISGFGDTGYTSASKASSVGTGFGPISDPLGASITGRVFDNLNNQIMFHNWNIQVAYAPQQGFGGKVEYSFGDDADIIHSYPQSLQNPANEIDLTQAYASYAGGPLTVIVGKFETLAGAEVIESPNDLNFSRSILFGYAVPFTHTGGRITYAVNGNLSLIAGANQGWDTTKVIPANGDVNYLTYEYGLAWNPSKAFALTAQGYTGDVPQGSANLGTTFYGVGPPRRTLTDFVATYHFNPALTFILNGDIAQQTNTILIDRSGTPTGIGTASWDGAALYISYTSGLFTLTGRGEYFADNGGSRTGATRNWEEGTGTLSYAPNSNLIFRAEYRYDASNNPFFATPASTTFDPTTGLPLGTPAFNNSGIGLEAIVKWP